MSPRELKQQDLPPIYHAKNDRALSRCAGDLQPSMRRNLLEVFQSLTDGASTLQDLPNDDER